MGDEVEERMEREGVGVGFLAWFRSLVGDRSAFVGFIYSLGVGVVRVEG